MQVGRLWLLVILAAAPPLVAQAEDKGPASAGPPSNTAPSTAPASPAAPAVPAAKPTDAAPPKPPAIATDAVVLDATALDAVIGRSVKSQTGEDMGRIVDVLVPMTGPVRAAVIDFGGFLGVGSRKIAVDWTALNFTDIGKSGNVIVALTRNQVRMAPEYKQGDPIVILEPTAPIAAAAKDVPKPPPPAPQAPASPPPAPPAPAASDAHK